MKPFETTLMLYVHCPSFCTDLPLFSPAGTFSLLFYFPRDITRALLFPSQDHPPLTALLYFSGFFCYATRGLELGPVDEREHMVSVSWLPHSTLSFLVLFTYLKFSLQLSNSPACMVPHVHYLLFCGRALGWFHLLAAVNRAARGIAQRASVTCKVKSFGSMTKSAAVGSDANCICSF